MKVEKLEQPISANERFLHAIALRLEILIEQVSGLSEHIAKRDGVATESNVTTVKEEVKKTPRKRTTTKK